MEIGGKHYADAIASDIDRSPSQQAWQSFADVFAKAYMLVTLESMAAAFTDARIRTDAAAAESQTIELSDIILDRFAKLSELDERISISFETGPFLESIKEFESRIPRLKSHVHRIVRESHALARSITLTEQAAAISALSRQSGVIQKAMSGSFFVSDASKGTIINLQALVGATLRGDGPRGVSEFIDEAQLRGAANLTRNRLETIYRNNLSSAANHGQVEILKDENIKRAIPLLKLNEIKDRRTRGNPAGLYPKGKHFQMDGYVGTVEEFEERGIIPPNGHNCRGAVRGLTKTEAEKAGFINEDGSLNPAKIAAHNGNRIAILDAGEYPDPNFSSIGSFAA